MSGACPYKSCQHDARVFAMAFYMFANVFWMVARWLLNITNYMMFPTSMLHDIVIYKFDSDPSLNVNLWDFCPILLHVITTSSAVVRGNCDEQN